MIQLIAFDGILHANENDIVDPLQKEHADGHTILYAGEGYDIRAIQWPRPDLQSLTVALYDAREMGLIPDVSAVLLPDGSMFNIDG